MPYFEKGSLAGRIKPGQPLDTESILDIAIKVAEGLSFAHRSGIIHRDLKPANILLGGNGRVCLADFGLARSVFNDTIVDVESRQLEGTAPYVSPAIAAGDAEDTRCDIYSFGALLYEMLTGQAPYQGRGTKEILDQILAGPPKPILSANPAADRGLVTVAETCMARELRDRYADMRDVLKDLRRVEAGQSPLTKRTDITGRTPKILLAALWLLGIALLASAGWMFFRERSESGVGAQTTNSTNPKPTAVVSNGTPPAVNTNTPVPTNIATPIVSQSPTNNPVISISNAPPTIAATNSSPTNGVANVSSNQTPVVVPEPAPATNTTSTPPPLAVKVIAPLTTAQSVVNQIAQLAAHGLDETIISNYAKENPPAVPLTVTEINYLRTNGVSENVVNILRQAKPAAAPPSNPSTTTGSTDVPALLKTAYAKYTSHENREAIEDCNRALKIDPQNPNAWCIKAVSEDALHNTAEAIIGYTTFLKLKASKAPESAAWRSYATSRLRAIRGW